MSQETQQVLDRVTTLASRCSTTGDEYLTSKLIRAANPDLPIHVMRSVSRDPEGRWCYADVAEDGTAVATLSFVVRDARDAMKLIAAEASHENLRPVEEALVPPTDLLQDLAIRAGLSSAVVSTYVGVLEEEMDCVLRVAPDSLARRQASGPQRIEVTLAGECAERVVDGCARISKALHYAAIRANVLGNSSRAGLDPAISPSTTHLAGGSTSATTGRFGTKRNATSI